jgi:hypothetical protein
MHSDTNILSQRIEQKLELLTQLRDLGQHQLALIRSCDMTQLLKLLAAKQRLLNALLTVERALDPFRDQDPEMRVWSSPVDRTRCAQSAARCEDLLAAIVQQERESQSHMTDRRDEVLAQFEAAGASALAHNAYAAPTVRSHQLDLTQG